MLNKSYIMRDLPQTLVQILSNERKQWVHDRLTEEDLARRWQCQMFFMQCSALRMDAMRTAKG